MAITFTSQQTRVLQARNHNILVSAAAGSGKTAVLVERIVRMISEGDHPLDIDRLLVVTFTKAAAAQMRERIGAAIAKRIEEDPDNTHLQRQETLLHNAQITTMDSFFTFLLRNNFSDIDMDPGFRQMDQTEGDLMRKDALEDFLEECYAAGDPSLSACTEAFCHNAGDKELEDILEMLYKQAVSHPDPEEWIRDRAADYDVSDEDALFSSIWMQFIILSAAERIRDLGKQYERILAVCGRPDGPALYIPLMREEYAVMRSLGECPSASSAGQVPVGEMKAIWARVLDILSMEFGSMPRFTAKKYPEVDPGLKEIAHGMRNDAKDKIAKLRKRYQNADPDSILASMRRVRPAAQALSDLTCRFRQYFQSVKKEQNVIDFADLEHLALQVLTEKDDDGNYQPRRAAMGYRQYFDEILIDEYQDSNEVQELLLRIISTEDEKVYNRFMVGDVKQSIYKFRLARPEIFMAKLAEYLPMDAEKERIDLDSNFRSRSEVLDSVNDVFFRLMRSEIGGVEYGEDVSLKAGASYPAAGDPDLYRTELILVGGPEDPSRKIPPEIERLSARQKEALAVAGRIRDLVGHLPVMGEDGLQRPCRYGDIVILLRSGAGWNEEFRDVFEKQGIPYYIESRTGYFSAGEIQAVLQMIRVLDNPRQDIPLYGVLRSYWGGFDEEDIARIRLASDRDADLYSCVAHMAECGETGGDPALSERCAAFLAFLRTWRGKTIYLGIRDLLTALFAETGYEEWCRAMPGGEQRSANLQLLLAQAASFDSMALSGLFDFVRYIDQVHHREVDYGEANILDENADVVRIMSIHKSKGLEFPVCFVAGTAKNHSYRYHDTKGSLICDNDWGIGMDHWDPVSRTKYRTIRKEAIADKIRRESLGEELRVLYVAMTRAKEKLILTGYLENIPDKCEDWEERLPAAMEAGEKLPTALLADSESFLELIWYAVHAGQGSGHFVIRTVNCADLVWNELRHQSGMAVRKQQLEQAGEFEGDPLPDPVLLDQLRKTFSRRYAHEDLRGLYTKTSVSELKLASLEEEGESAYEIFPENNPAPVIPFFAAEDIAKAAGTDTCEADSEEGHGSPQTKSAFTGTEYGTAVHRLLELFDYGRFRNPAQVDQAAFDLWRRELADGGRIPASYADELPAGGILSFLHSELAGRMADADSRGALFREQPFVLGIEANRLNPEFPRDETVLVQGIIDAYFIENGELILVDYKTDRVFDPQELRDRYQIQLDLYEQALSRITGMKVREKLIYSISLRRVISL